MSIDPVSTAVLAAGVLAAAKRAEDFIAAVTNHPGESIGTILGNVVKRRRENAEQVAGKANLILLDIGVTPREVPLNIIQPLLEGASLQEEPSLQDVWANLLANAADPRQNRAVLPAYAGMLKELSSRDVKFMDMLYTKVADPGRGRAVNEEFTEYTLKDAFVVAGLARFEGFPSVTHGDWQKHRDIILADERDFQLTVDAAKRLYILREMQHENPRELEKRLARILQGEQAMNPRTESRYAFTTLGIDFILACRAPEASKASDGIPQS